VISTNYEAEHYENFSSLPFILFPEEDDDDYLKTLSV
jgi:hypothetical protein